MEVMERLNVLEAKLNIVISYLEKLNANDDSRIVCVSEIADYLGMSPRTLYNKPWLLPNFGEGKESKGKEYQMKEVKEWLSKGAENLRSEYEKRSV